MENSPNVLYTTLLTFSASVYQDGPDALTLKRLARLQKLGIVKEGVDFAPPVGTLGKEWKDMTQEEKNIAAKKMEVFAAMVEAMDTQIGRLIDYLEEQGELDNTFILFMSDNGAEGGVLEALPVSPCTLNIPFKTIYAHCYHTRSWVVPKQWATSLTSTMITRSKTWELIILLSTMVRPSKLQ